MFFRGACAKHQLLRLIKKSMAQIETNRSNGHKKNHPHSLKVDLTPMVDIGFLLITFFILTTNLSMPVATKLMMPKDTGLETPVQQSAVLNIILGKNHQLSYSEGYGRNTIACNFISVRSVIIEKQHKVALALGSRDKTILIIRPSKESTYQDFMRIIDEISINDIKIYYVENPEEKRNTPNLAETEPWGRRSNWYC